MKICEKIIDKKNLFIEAEFLGQHGKENKGGLSLEVYRFNRPMLLLLNYRDFAEGRLYVTISSDDYQKINQMKKAKRIR